MTRAQFLSSRTALTLALILTAAAIAACSLQSITGSDVIIVTATASSDAQQIIYVTATFLPSDSAPTVIIPAATSTPDVTVTATLPVPQAVAQANTALHNGDFDTALGIYQSVLSVDKLSVDPRLRAESMLGFGTAKLREGLYVDAVDVLTAYIKDYPTGDKIAQAYFLRGDAYLGMNEWALAIPDFELFLQKRPGLIDSYCYERIGDAHLALQNPNAALGAYANAVKGATPRGLRPLLLLREKVAATYINGGNLGAALEQYDAILTAAQNKQYRASIALSGAQMAAALGRTDDAIKRYQDILNFYPDTVEANRAAIALIAANVEVDNLARGKAAFAAEDYDTAITALYTYTGDTEAGQIDPSVYMLLGRAYREVGNVNAANVSFQTIINLYPTTSLFGQAWLETGRTFFLANDPDKAIERYREFATKHPDTSGAAEALWRIGYIYSARNDTTNAYTVFEELGTKYPGSEWASDGLFRAAMAAYNAGETGRASRLFGLLATAPGAGNLKAAGLLWLGRLYQTDNKPELARESYRQAALADPGGYYSLRANDLFRGQSPYTPPTQLDFTFGTPEQKAQADDWMRRTFSITAPGDLWRLSPELQASSAIVRGTELWDLAAYDDAKGEFAALTEANAENPLALYQLAVYYHQIGNYREMINTAAVLINSSGVPTENAPKYIAGLRFPVAYSDLILPNTAKYKLDPLLVFALIRQESLYDGVAFSTAAAQGLMQIIPPTGAEIAEKLAWPNYQNSDLYRPYVNVAFGVFYLHEQMERFDGKPYAALAAYNAGPGAAIEWNTIARGDPDLFVQAVSYDETQLYVRRIYEQYNTYAAIYGVSG